MSSRPITLPDWKETIAIQQELDKLIFFAGQAVTKARDTQIRSLFQSRPEQDISEVILRHALIQDEPMKTQFSSALAWKAHYERRYHEISYWLSSQRNQSFSEAVPKLRLMRATAGDSRWWDDARWTPPGETESFSDYNNVSYDIQRLRVRPVPYHIDLSLVGSETTGSTTTHTVSITTINPGAVTLSAQIPNGAVVLSVEEIVFYRQGIKQFTVSVDNQMGTVEVSAALGVEGNVRTASLSIPRPSS